MIFHNKKLFTGVSILTILLECILERKILYLHVHKDFYGVFQKPDSPPQNQ